MSEIIELEMQLSQMKEKISYLSSHVNTKNPEHWVTKLINKLETDIYNFSDQLIKLKQKQEYQEKEIDKISKW